MKKMIISLSVGLLTAALNGAFAAPAEGGAPAAGDGQPPPKHAKSDHGGKGRPGMDLSSLKLTDEQKQKIEAIHQSHRAEMEAAMKAVRALHDNKDADPAAVKTAMDAAKAIHDKVSAEVDAILTPEQKVKMDELRKAREAKRKEHQGKEGGHKGGDKAGGPKGEPKQ